MRQSQWHANEADRHSNPRHSSANSSHCFPGFGVPHADVAQLLGISAKTMVRHFCPELDVGAAVVQAKLVKSLIAMAAGDDDTALNATTFLLCSRFGWSPERHDVGGPAAPTAATEAAEGELI